MRRPKHPCVKDCPRRTAECKRTCADWAAYEAEWQAEMRARTEEFELADALIEMGKRRANMHAEGKWRNKKY